MFAMKVCECAPFVTFAKLFVCRKFATYTKYYAINFP